MSTGALYGDHRCDLGVIKKSFSEPSIYLRLYVKLAGEILEDRCESLFPHCHKQYHLAVADRKVYSGFAKYHGKQFYSFN